MIYENDGHEVQEESLFHGTSKAVLEAICKKGFDWRLSGKHGTVYGQGMINHITRKLTFRSRAICTTN